MFDPDTGFSCPISFLAEDKIQLAHGGGGKMMQDLLHKIIFPIFNSPLLANESDSAILNIGENRLAFTTDSYVVNPLVFPGGDIGSLAVNGTINDLAVCGAKPLFLSVALIIEEGFSVSLLKKIMNSLRLAADQGEVFLVTGDTKVVDKGKGDGIFINTSGIGIVEKKRSFSYQQIEEGDAIIINGDLARHGIVIMSARENLGFETELESDCAALWSLVEFLLSAGIKINCMRDPTRGGIASVLNELANLSGKKFRLWEKALPIREEVKGACEIFGFDPLYIANEGKILFFIPKNEAKEAIRLMKKHPLGKDSVQIGEVLSQKKGIVTIKSLIGTERIVDLISGEQLPRIC